jgi:hypothetical protein
LTQLAMQLIRQWGVAGREKSCGLGGSVPGGGGGHARLEGRARSS